MVRMSPTSFDPNVKIPMMTASCAAVNFFSVIILFPCFPFATPEMQNSSPQPAPLSPMLFLPLSLAFPGAAVKFLCGIAAAGGLHFPQIRYNKRGAYGGRTKDLFCLRQAKRVRG